MTFHRYAFLCSILSVCALATTALAQTSTAQFTVQITITASCRLTSATNLDFGSNGVITGNIDAASAITAQCTSSTPYNISLNAGSGTGATVANRLMTGPASATISYSLYTTAARTTVWGNTVGTNTVSGTGTGAPQIYSVYGRVGAQNTPAPGLYTDTITAAISY